MKTIKLDEMINQGEVIVHVNNETGLVISANTDNMFIYFRIDETDECEFASPFPIEDYIDNQSLQDEDITFVDVLIKAAKKLATDIQTNKVSL